MYTTNSLINWWKELIIITQIDHELNELEPKIHFAKVVGLNNFDFLPILILLTANIKFSFHIVAKTFSYNIPLTFLWISK